MAQFIHVNDTGFVGRHREFWNYTNRDSTQHRQTCCGQAAVYSAQRTVRDAEFRGGFTRFVESSPPDNFFGVLGTSPGRIADMLRGFGLSGRDRNGAFQLRDTLKSRPAIVCLDTNKLDSSNIGLHWVAVFGYGAGDYYVSNVPQCRIPYGKFYDAWSAPLNFVAGVSERLFRA